MKKIVLLVSFLLAGFSAWAEETFESQIYNKEVQLVYGNGTLSVQTEVYSIMVLNKDVYMKIEVPKKAYEILKVADRVRITYEKGLFDNEIKAIALLRPSPTPKT